MSVCRPRVVSLAGLVADRARPTPGHVRSVVVGVRVTGSLCAHVVAPSDSLHLPFDRPGDSRTVQIRRRPHTLSEPAGRVVRFAEDRSFVRRVHPVGWGRLGLVWPVTDPNDPVGVEESAQRTPLGLRLVSGRSERGPERPDPFVPGVRVRLRQDRPHRLTQRRQESLERPFRPE